MNTERDADRIVLSADLDALKAKIEDILRPAHALSRALADKLHVAKRTKEFVPHLAHVLVHTPGKIIATILADLDATIDVDRDIVRELLFQTLPLAVDWRALLLQARTAFSGDAKAVELPLRTETIAEIVVAGAEGRSCQFAPGGRMPHGASGILMPAAAYAPFFQGDGERLVEAVIMNLGQEGESDDRYWSTLRRRFPRYSELKIVVRKTLDNHARKNSSEWQPFYFLVIDEELGVGRTNDVDELWVGAQAAFGRELPNLRLVRLTGGAEELSEEVEVAASIKTVRDL